MTSVLHDNPIARAELRYQQRMPLPRSGRHFPTLLLLLLIVALLSHVALALEPQLTLLFAIPRADLHEVLRGWFGTLVVVTFVLIMVQHLSLAAFGVQVAAVSVAREKQAHTWESLLLTGIDARRIVVGKWLATVQTTLISYRWLFVLRFAIVVWIGLSSSVVDFYPWYEPPPLHVIIVYAALIAIFPPVFTAYSAALGLLAGLITSSQNTAARIGGLLHLGTILLSLAMMGVLFVFFFQGASSGWSMLVPILFLTPIDGGMLTLISLFAGGSDPSMNYWIGIALCVVLYAVLTLALLRLDQAVAVRKRALPPT